MFQWLHIKLERSIKGTWQSSEMLFINELKKGLENMIIEIKDDTKKNDSKHLIKI